MIPASDLIAQDLATLEADRRKPDYQLGETVTATLGPTTITGRVEAWHDRSGLLTIHPHGLESHRFSTMDVWVRDGWTVLHVTEVP